MIHGRGTGAVRKAVRDELARHPLVVSHESESADGATLVRLRLPRPVSRPARTVGKSRAGRALRLRLRLGRRAALGLAAAGCGGDNEDDSRRRDANATVGGTRRRLHETTGQGDVVNGEQVFATAGRWLPHVRGGRARTATLGPISTSLAVVRQGSDRSRTAAARCRRSRTSCRPRDPNVAAFVSSLAGNGAQ